MKRRFTRLPIVQFSLVAVSVLAERTYPMGGEAAQAILRQEPD